MAKTVSVTLRFPEGLINAVNEEVEKGMYTNTSEAIRSLVGRALNYKEPKRITKRKTEESNNEETKETGSDDLGTTNGIGSMNAGSAKEAESE